MSRDAFDKVFDAILDDVAKQVDEELGNNLEEYDGAIEYSKNHNRKIKKLFKSQRRKESKKQTVKTILMCILAVLLIFVSLFAFCEPFRIRFLNTYLELKENINFDFSLTGNSKATYKDEYIELGYIPKGFEVYMINYLNTQNFYKFKNDDNYFQITISENVFKSSVDTEKGYSQQININGNIGTYFSNNNLNFVVWNNGDTSIRVYGNISKYKLSKIAKNLKILK